MSKTKKNSRDLRLRERDRRATLLFFYILIIYAIIFFPPFRESARYVFSVTTEHSEAAIGDIFGVKATTTRLGTFATDAPCQGITHTIEAGSSDWKTTGQVTLLQEFMKRDPVLYPEGLVTGYAGPGTVRAIGRFQIRHGLAKEGAQGYGVLGPETRRKLNKEFCAAERTENGLPDKSSPKGLESLRGRPSGLRSVSATSTKNVSRSGLSSNTESLARLSPGEPRHDPNAKPPLILAIVGPRALGLGKLGTWTIQAASDDGKPLTYGIYWGNIRSGRSFGDGAQFSSSKLPTFSTAAEKVGSYELIFVARGAGGPTYQSITVSVGGAQFRGGRITFDVRDGSFVCPNNIPTCNRFAYGGGRLVRIINEEAAMPIGESRVSKGFLSWQSLRAGQYIATISIPGYKPYERKFALLAGEDKLVKVFLEKDVSFTPQLLRVVPEASFYGEYVMITGKNLSLATKAYLDDHYIGTLEARDGTYGFIVPRAASILLDCTNDLVLSRDCVRPQPKSFRPGVYKLKLKNASGESTPTSFEIFEKSTVRPFSPALMAEQEQERVRGGVKGGLLYDYSR